MKRFFLFVFFVTTFLLQAQIRFEVKDVKQIYDGDNYYSINVNLMVWNLGAKTEIHSLLQGIVDEWKFRKISTTFHEEIADFFLIYKSPHSGQLSSKNFPASITIKTIYGNYIAMNSPEYLFNSTGAKSAQEWNVLYTMVPKGAFEIQTKILGEVKQLTDLPGADDARKNILEKKRKTLKDAEMLYSKGKYEKSIKKYLESFFLSPEIKKTYSYKVAKAYYQLALDLQSNNNYLTAIEKYDKSLDYDKTQTSIINSKKANCYLKLAEYELDKKNYNKSSKFFREAYSLDNNLKSIINIKTQSFKKSKLNSFYSILPGLGQYINGKELKGIIHLGAFSLSTYLGINSQSKANDIYAEYQLATNTISAETLYKDASNELKSSYIYFGISATIIVYSIIDNYMDISSFNELFEVTANSRYDYYNQYADYNLLNIKLKF